MGEQVFPRLSDFSPKGLVQMADEHDDAAFALALGSHPAMRAEPGFYELLTGINDPFANMAFGMNVPDAENRVLAISERLRKSECPAYFWVGPCTKPFDLSEILVRNGWVHLASPPAMVVELDHLKEPVLLEGFELIPVRNSEELAIWQETMAKGFNVSNEVGKIFSPPLRDPVRLYSAYLNGQPVGTTALVFHNGVAGIYSLAVLPKFRRQGIGALLTVLPLIEAWSEGYRLGTLQASSMGLPVYLQLGFAEVCKLKMFGFGL
jgi:GNAT superfamily N-acetyltransferase